MRGAACAAIGATIAIASKVIFIGASKSEREEYHDSRVTLQRELAPSQNMQGHGKFFTSITMIGESTSFVYAFPNHTGGLVKSSMLLGSLLLFSVIASAETATYEDAKPELVAQFPATLKCTSGGISELVRSFEITKLDTVEPESTIEDASLMDPPQVAKAPYGSDRYGFTLSNQCDNGYGIQFFVEQLVALKNGTIQKIYGVLDYGDVYIFEETSELTSGEKIVITCTL